MLSSGFIYLWTEHGSWLATESLTTNDHFVVANKSALCFLLLSEFHATCGVVWKRSAAISRTRSWGTISLTANSPRRISTLTWCCRHCSTPTVFASISTQVEWVKCWSSAHRYDIPFFLPSNNFLLPFFSFFIIGLSAFIIQGIKVGK